MYTTHPLNPLNLPEIRAVVAEFLQKGDIASCILVCKAWHSSFLPALWNDFNLENHLESFEVPSLASISRNCHLIRSFSSINCDMDDYTDILPFPNLTTLYAEASQLSEYSLIDQHPHLRHISLSADYPLRTFSFKDYAPLGGRLKELYLVCLTVDWADAQEMSEVFSHLQRMRLYNISFSSRPLKMEFAPYPHQIRELEITNVDGITVSEQWSIFNQCPQLEDLWWRITADNVKETEFSVIASLLQHIEGKTTWPRLHYVRLEIEMDHGCSGSRLMGYMRSGSEMWAKWIKSSWDRWGPSQTRRVQLLSSPALLVQYPFLLYLTALDLSDFTFQSEGTGADQSQVKILACCPKLRSCSVANPVDAQEIADGKWNDAWVCRDTLEEITIRIELKAEISSAEQLQQKNDSVFRMLSELYNLERGEVTLRWTAERSLGFKLERGLSYMSALSKLREEVEGIIQH
ncbi:MAG: hypothetical protein J3R72DRAFT_455296 [Linnemannia gamsii]|nr:MAG: hypothetical protein J3R72DRAFT_455296 [Linnemannia gamsii]